MKDTCKQAIFRKDIRQSQESCRSLESGDQDKIRTGVFQHKPTQPEVPTVFIKSMHDDGPTSSKPLPEFNPDDLVGRTFLLPPGDNGERLRPKVTRKVVEVSEKGRWGESPTKSAKFFVLAMGNLKKSSPITNWWTTWKLQPMRIMR